MDDDFNYCRLCMALSDLTEMEIPLIEVIQNDFFIEVNDENELSKEICRGCEDFLLKYISFKSKMEETQILLRRIRKGKNKKDNEVVLENTSKKNNFSTPAPERKNLNDEEVVIIEESRTKKFEQPAPKKKRCEVQNDVINLIENNNFFEQISEQKSSTVGTKSTIVDNSNRTNTENDSSEIMEDDIISKIVKSIDINNMPENIQEQTIWNPEKPYCNACNTKITDSTDYEKHVNSKVHKFRQYVIHKMKDSTIFNSYRVGYTCQCCKEVFTSKAVMCQHAKDAHKYPMNRNIIGPDTIILKKKTEDRSKMIEDEIKKEPGIAQKAFKCRFCEKYFGFEESLKRHHKKHHKEIFSCMYCNHFAKNRKSFVIHLREHYHLQFNQEMCSSCFKIFKNHKELTNHRKKDHPVTVFVCNFCKEKFINPTLLKKHKRNCHRTKNEELDKQNVFMCKRCNRSFLSALVLEKHKCAGLKFPCIKKCCKRFETYSEMERHSVKCTLGTTIYQCKFCTKYLKSLYTLQKHMLTCPKQSTSISARTSSTSVRNICPNEASSETQPQSDHQSSPVKRKIEASSSKKLDQKNVFKCGKCLKDISSIESLNRHLKRCRRPEQPSTREKIKKSVKRLNSKLLKVRTPKTTSKRTINIESKVQENSKISNTHSSSNEKTCHVCGIAFKNELHLNAHLFNFHKIIQTSTPPPSLPEKYSSEESTLKIQSKDEDKITNSCIRIPSSTPLNSSAPPAHSNSRYDDGSLSKTEQRHKIIKTSTPSPTNNSTPVDGNGINSFIRIPSTTPLNLSASSAHSNSRYDDRSLSKTEQRHKILKTSTPLPVKNSRTEDLKKITNSVIRIPSSTPLNSSAPPAHSNSRYDDRSLPKTEQRHKILKTSTPLSTKNSRITDSFIHNPLNSSAPPAHSNSRYYDRSLPKTEQRHYRSNTSEFSSRYSKDAPVSPVTNVTQRKATSTKLFEPEYIKTGNMSASQLTIIPNTSGTCNICRSTAPHLFCSPCARCFRQNQVQYINHMKMKHSISK